MSNLFQDVNGTTPVTADGQPVGLVLDSSRGGALGSELIVNGTFDTDLSGWSISTGGWSWDNGTARLDGDGSLQAMNQFIAVAGKVYELTVDVSNLSGELIFYDNTTSRILQNGTNKFTFEADTNLIQFKRQGGIVTANIDNVSLKEVFGTHASQPVATQRPTYKANPDRLTLDLVDDGLLVNIPVGGWDGYMVVGTDQGTASYGVSLPAGDYELGGDYFFGNTINQVLFREGAVEPAHLKAIEYVFIGDGAKESYGDVTDFSSYWRLKNITEFPLIDTSSGINFNAAWHSNNLTSFPLIDTSNGTSFSFAWYNNDLTSFPLINTSSGTSFAYTWYNNDLTSFPLIDTSSGISFAYAWAYNNLTSFPLLDTSSGTNFQGAWQNNSLTDFPLIDTSSGIIFQGTWRDNNLTGFPLIDTGSGTNFRDAWINNSLTSFPLLDTSSGTNFQAAWYGNNLTSFPLIDTSSGTDFRGAWYGNNLTSFPLIDTSNGTDFSNAWQNNSLTEFPLLDTGSGTNFGATWRDNNLAEFPLLDTSSGTNFYAAWWGNDLTSFPLIDTSSGTNFAFAWRFNQLISFPLIDTSSGTRFDGAWDGNNALANFPANMFDNCPCTNFTDAFLGTALTQASIDGILVSINSNGTSNGTFNQTGGSAPSATGQSAIDAMRSRGWTITVTGGY